MSTVRSVDVRLNALVSGYISDMRRAGRETDRAFASSSAGIEKTNRELGVAQQRMRGVDDAGKSMNRTLGRANTRTRVLGEQTKLLNDHLDVAQRRFVETDRVIQRTADTSLPRLGQSSERTGKEIDKLSGRVGILRDLVVTLGPGLVPLAAVGVPALAGAAAQMGLMAAGAGATILAFHGMGEAVKALDAAQLDPTAESVAKLNKEMNDLAPAAQDFVVQLDSLMPRLSTVQRAAAQGFFPGAGRGLDELLTMLPQARGLVYELASTMGDLAAEQADAFASPRGREFLTFLQSEAKPGLTDLMHTVSNLTAGMGELWMSFDPLNDDFSKVLLDASQSFDQWATGLDKTQGFQDFVAYLRANGPQVADTLGAIANMGLKIVEAAAPLGGPVLNSLEAVANAVSAIADSDLGTPLFTAASAAVVLNRALQITSGLLTKVGAQQGGTAAGGMIGQVRGQAATGFAAIQTGAATASTRVKTLGSDLRAMSEEYRRAAATTTRVSPSLFGAAALGQGAMVPVKPGKETGAAGSLAKSFLSNTTEEAHRTRAALAGVAKGAGLAGAAVGAMAVLTTDAGQSLGLTNTAILGMAGTMAGPWGAALGAGVGYLLDFKSASNDASDSVTAFKTAIDNQFVSLSQYQTATAQLAADTRASIASSTANDSGFSAMLKSLTPKGAQTNLDVLFGGFDSSALGKQVDAAGRAQESLGNLKLAGQLLAKQMGVVSQSTDNNTISTDQMDEALRRAQPAMSELGITTQDVIKGIADGSFVQISQEIAAYQAHADSAAGRTKAFAASVQDLANDALSTADSASAMGSALEALLSPTLNAEGATDAWRQSLKDLRSELDSDAGFKGFGDAAMKNREQTRSYVTDSMARLTALAGVSTTTEKTMANAVQQTRTAFIQSGIAAGFSRKEIVRRADALGLTPKLVRTVFEAAGISKADLEARQLKATYNGLPKNVRTALHADGIPQTMGQVDQLVAKYHLTEKERRALITIKDAASGPLRAVLVKLGIVDRQRPTPVTSVVDHASGPLKGLLQLLGFTGRQHPTPTASLNNQASGPLSGVLGMLHAADGYHAESTVTVTTIHRTLNFLQKGVIPNAQGGYYPSVRAYAYGGTDLADRHLPELAGPGPIRVWREPETGGESYIPHANDARRPRAKAILEQTASMFGGQVQWYAQGGMTGPTRPGTQNLRVSGTLDTPWGPAHIEGIARDAARSEITGQERFNRDHRGGKRG